MPARSAKTTFRNEADTEAFAAWLAPRLRVGDIVLLDGNIGSGKSFLARCLILARLAEPEDIPSPTFTIVQTYDDRSGIEIWHLDLYRLTDPSEVLELGLEAAMSEAICLVEWPDRYGDQWPETYLRLRLSTNDQSGARDVSAEASSDRWAKILDHIDDL